MKFKALLLALLCTTIFQWGCYHAIVRGGPHSAMAPEHRTGINFAWGLSSAEFDAADCPYGLAKVDTYFPWYSWFVRLVTIGIVTPHSVRYVCAAPSAAAYPVAPTYPSPPAQPVVPPTAP